VRRTWMRYALRGVFQRDAHARLDLAYTFGDPWHMDSELERFRFAETNRIIVDEIAPRVHSLLEIGCGEGHQSEWLTRLCDRHTGIDVSPRAVERARRRLPAATLLAGDLYAQPWSNEGGRFDLVTGCEVIHYISDPRQFLHTIDRLGRACLVTYCAPVPENVRAAVMAMPGARDATFRFDKTEWIAVWWLGATAR
jgi:2-polyprenyl-3-methyl-5-hydroxy-6-metoxy-1,4-benzoquinol methylase